MARGENTADHPGRKVHREVFDTTTVSNAYGEPMTRTNVSRYDEGGNFISQGYTEVPKKRADQVAAIQKRTSSPAHRYALSQARKKKAP
jgi:hypothetical protein